jgi:RNA polymerase sigma-70 factor (ECF subfamily)
MSGSASGREPWVAEGEATVPGLIDAARRGREDARARLLERYRNYLRLLARTSVARRLQAKVDASDMVQEVFLKANARFDQFAGRSDPELAAWLRRILANCLADVGRRYARNEGRDIAREESLEDELDRSSKAIARFLEASHTSPSGAAEQGELSVAVADALARMEEDDREVIVLRNFEDLEWSEIGRRMARSADAARKLWARALTRLRPLMGGKP